MPLVSRTFDQLINFTRTSAATFVGSNGLVQTTPASKNILTFTQEFDNAAWTKTSVTVTANSTVAPDTTSTADTITAVAAASQHLVFLAATNLTGGTQWTASVYAKAGTHGFMQILHSSNPDYFANFNLTTGVVGTVGPGATSTAITPVGDGWYRCSMTFTPLATGTIRFASISAATSVYNQSWTPAGTETFFLWGTQAEIAAAPTTYTRNFGGLFPPRFDYSPVTLLPRGLLVEQQVTNLLLYSEQFDNAYWTASGVTVTANTSVSPDGATTADTLDDGVTTGLHRVFRASITTTAAAQTVSCYVKAGTGTWFQLLMFDGTTSFYANFNVSTGVVGNKQASATSSIVSMGNGWYRCILTATTAATAAGNFQLVPLDADTAAPTPSFTGTNRTWFVWGAQHEVLPFASSYIPTVASQVTRTSDQPTIAAPNFASWYNSSEGTLVTEYDVIGINTSSEVVAAISDATANNLFLPFVNSGGSTFINVISGGVTSANLNAGLVATNTTIKLATVYRANDFAASQNGAVPTVDTAGAVPVGANTLNLGWAAPYGGLFLNGHLRRLYFYPTRLTNAQLQALST